MKRIASFALLACFACSSSPGPAKPFRRESERAAPLGAVGKFDQAIQELLDGSKPLELVRLRVLWRQGEQMVSADLHGGGVGFWDSRAQFRLTRPEVESLVRSLREAKFGSMPPSYGHEEDDMLRLAGMMSVSIGGVEKTVHQFATGEQSAELSALAEHVLALARERAKNGTTIASLDDGLKKLAGGALAPDAFELAFVARREARDPAPAGTDGWLLRLSGREARLQTFERQKGYGAAREWQLPENEFHALIAALRRSDVASLPASLDAPEYRDLHVRVLDKSKDLIARRLSDPSRERRSPDERRFDELVRGLDRLRESASRTVPAPAASD